MLDALHEHVETSPVVRAAEDLRDSSTALAWHVLEGVARECSSLAWEIQHMVPGSLEQDRARSRRIDGLVSLAKLRVSIAEAERSELTPTKLATLTELLVAEVENVAHAVLPPEVAAMFVTSVRAEIPDTPRRPPEKST